MGKKLCKRIHVDLFYRFFGKSFWISVFFITFAAIKKTATRLWRAQRLSEAGCLRLYPCEGEWYKQLNEFLNKVKHMQIRILEIDE